MFIVGPILDFKSILYCMHLKNLGTCRVSLPNKGYKKVCVMEPIVN